MESRQHMGTLLLVLIFKVCTLTEFASCTDTDCATCIAPKGAACTATELALCTATDRAGMDLKSTEQELVQNLTTAIEGLNVILKQGDVVICNDCNVLPSPQTEDNCNLKQNGVDTNEKDIHLPIDCTEILDEKVYATSGVYKIHPDSQHVHLNTSNSILNVYCDMHTDGGGWTVFQRRLNGAVDFYRDWEDYKLGFGYAKGDYWLGLQNLHLLTSTATYELRVDLEDFDGNTAYAQYDTFNIAEERLAFKLMVGGYRGTAGDGLAKQNNAFFSTRDQDHDTWDGGHCVGEYKGAWWQENCMRSNLNALYLGQSVDDPTGMAWYTWENNWKVLKKSEMKIRRINE